MSTMRTTLLLLGALSALATAAYAQRPQTREGFWISFGPGVGSATFDCEGCTIADELKGTGATFHVRLGGTPSSKLLIGAELAGWAKEEAGFSSTAAIVAAVAYLYPTAEGGLFLKGGIGYTGYSVDDGIDEVTSSGYGILLGVGYDLRVARNFSITPVATLTTGGFGDLEFNGSLFAEKWRQTVVEIALGFTFH